MAVKVLVVDDSGFFRRRVSEILSADPSIQVVGTATNGKEAIDQAMALKPDVITMDYEMPMMDGITATKIIRSEISGDIPIIALTANALRSELDHCIAAGMNDFVTKPFDETTLIRVLLKYLQ